MAPPSYYAWGAEWMPVSVLLHAVVMDQINQSIAAADGVRPGRGNESGGILLGTIDRLTGVHPVVRIEKLEPFECEHRRGPSFVLTDRDKRSLGKRLAWWNGARSGDLRPVGFYRSHTRRGLYLDNDDFTLFQAYFMDPGAVFLLVRPEGAPSNVGGFFFWEEGDMHRESSYQAFSFDPARLPLVSPAPAIAPPAPVPTATTSGRDWLRTVIPVAAALALAVTLYGIGAVAIARRTRPFDHPTLAVAPAAAPVPVVPMDKPSPIKGKPVAQTPALLPAHNPPPAVVVVEGSPINSVADVILQPAPAPPAAPLIASSTPPPVLPSIDVPLRSAPPRKYTPVALVTVEPVAESRVGRFVGKIPGLRRLEKKKHGFIPARPIREVAPTVPASRELAHAVPVDLRVTVDLAGNVSSVEPTKGTDRQLTRLAVDAARGWRFEPARRNEETVSSELILHFTFRPPFESGGDGERP